LAVFFSLLLAVPGVVSAADCNGLLVKAKREFSVVKRQQMLEQALTVCPADAELNYEYGYSFERFRKYGKALSYYRKALSLQPETAKAWFGIGDIQRSNGKLKDARHSYEKGLRYAQDKRVIAKLNEIRKGFGLGPFHLVVKTAVPKPSPAAKVKSAAKHPSPMLKAITRLRVHFADNSYKLDLDARDVISVLVGQALLNKDLAGVALKVVGVAGNSDLARKRAARVRAYLLDNFAISAGRLVTEARLLSSSDKGGGVEFQLQ